NGAVVGEVLQETTDSTGETIIAQVYREVAGMRLRFNVAPDGFQTVGLGHAVNFDGADCTGNPFVDAGSVTTAPAATFLTQASVHNNTLYRFDTATSMLYNQ